MIGVPRLEGRRVLLTGAASGIGRTMTRRLVAEGASVFAVDVDAEGLASTTRACEGPGRVRVGVCDVTSESAVARTVGDAIAALDGIDTLVNAAVIHRATSIEKLTVDDLHLLLEVNVVALAMLCREAVAHLSRGGVIVNVVPRPAAPLTSADSASRGAVLGFSASLAAELDDWGIRVSSVPPEPDLIAAALVRDPSSA
ncbi:SDR family NAD(P)-dependent oxidoreductase [Nocardioides piscis]|uniref:SDR family oxidoreductase n=1 Tax=Nocardioides piscis TaxID=2714938 RepID=A0A6G7YHN3_9ACTN|nr:SDR family oxidoreductase [Nocardioides piscis]QIK76127.1 SDR family oxidoreductase [Nocardioides piscis]